MDVKIKLLENGLMPRYGRAGDACLDCYADIDSDVDIKPGERTLVSLGFCLELPDGYEAVIRPRSGLTKKGIDIGIGTVDSNYRGEVKACVINSSSEVFTVHKDDRICQLAVRKTENVNFISTGQLSDSNRGSCGFGSSGMQG